MSLETHGPRGGAFVASSGNEVSFRIFRVQLSNDSNRPIDLKLDLPSGPVALAPDSSVRLRLFFFPKALAPGEAVDANNFGIHGVERYLDSDVVGDSTLEESIAPGATQWFYLGVVFESELDNGLTRAGLFVEGEEKTASFLPSTSQGDGGGDDVDEATERGRSTSLNLWLGIGVDPPRYHALFPCGRVEVQSGR